ncbi:hypothetical protein Aduo_002200 [Ancylostoma duodenale]
MNSSGVLFRVYLCFIETPARTAKGVKGLNLEDACESSLKFLPMEQMVYKFENGVGTPFAYVLPVAKFIAIGDENEQNFILKNWPRRMSCGSASEMQLTQLVAVIPQGGVFYPKDH